MGGLLTTGNPKTAKGEGHGYFTAILHLAPSKVSGRNTCANSTAGCAAACLNTAGRGGINLDADGLNAIQVARIRRTRYAFEDRASFLSDLAEEIRTHVRRANKHGLTPAVRLNGTSDLRWERFEHDGHANIFAAFPHVQFYDYTKHPPGKRDVSGIPNYHLTFSLAESNDRNAVRALCAGVNVAVVFDTRKSGDLPASFAIDAGDGTMQSARVVDGDATDLRFLDPVGVIVGLRAKGRAKTDTTGFVRRGN